MSEARIKAKCYNYVTNNHEVRLTRHNAGATSSTKSGRPWELVYKDSFPDKLKLLYEIRVNVDT